HPKLLQEQQRLAEIKRLEPPTNASTAQTTTRRNTSGLSEPTVAALRRVSDALRRASGAAELPVPGPFPAPASEPRRQTTAPPTTPTLPQPARTTGPRADANPPNPRIQ
ncbi:MAG: hypothetical protein ABL898_18620, partial [Hyphomicrobiaceae bacterium]